MEKDLNDDNHVEQVDTIGEGGDVVNMTPFEAAMAQDPPKPFAKSMIIMYICCFIGFLNSTMNGYDGSLMNSLFSNNDFKEFFGSSNVGVKAGIISGMYQIGGVSALPFVGPLVDTWGRRAGMVIGCFIIVIGTIISGTTTTNHSLGQFLAGRFFLGFGISISTSAGPMYVVELAHPAYRGVLTGVYNVFWFTGSITASGAVRGSINLSNNKSWSVPIWVQMAAPSLVVLIAMFLPESPRWLYVNNKQEKAKEIIIKFHGLGNPDSAWVRMQMAEYEEFLDLDGSDKRWWDYRALFRDRPSIYRVVCNVVVSIFGQWAGNGVVSYYLSGVLDTAGITDEVEQLNINLGLACTQFAFALFGSSLVERVGRRPMLIGVNVALSAIWVGVTAATGTFDSTGNKSAGWATVALIFIFGATYSVGFTPLQALYPVEVLSFEQRAKGMAFSSLAVNAGGLVNQFGWPVALSNIGWKTYIVFVVWCACQATILYFLIPETKGLTLEELDEIFKAPSPRKASTNRRQAVFVNQDKSVVLEDV